MASKQRRYSKLPSGLLFESLEDRRLLAGDLFDWNFDGDGVSGGTVDSAGSQTDWIYNVAPPLVGNTGTGFEILSGSTGTATQNNNVLKVVGLPNSSPQPLQGNGVLKITNGNGGVTNARLNFGAGLSEGIVDFWAAFDAGSNSRFHSSQIRLVGGGSVLARINLNGSHNGGGFNFQYGNGSGGSATTDIDEQFSDFGNTLYASDVNFRNLAHHFQISWKDNLLSMYVNRVGVNPTTGAATPLTDVLIKDQPFDNGLTAAPNRLEFYIGSQTYSISIYVDQLRVSDTSMPVIAANQYFDVKQASTAGTVVAGGVNLVDQVYGSSATFTKTGGTGLSLFNIDTVVDSNGERRGKISVAPGVTLPGSGSYTLNVRLQDGTAFSATETITINVVNQTIAEKILATHLGAGYSEAPNYTNAVVSGYLTELDSNGKFSTLNYTTSTQFFPGMERLAGMAEVYSKGTYSDTSGNGYTQATLKAELYLGLQYWLNMSRYVSEYTPTHPWSQNQMVISAATSLYTAITADINGANATLRDQATKLRDSIIEETEKDLRFVDKNENFEGANRSYRYQGLRARAAFINDYNRASTSNTYIDNFASTGQLSDLARLIQTNAIESAGWTKGNGITEDGGFAHHTDSAIQNLTLTYGKDWFNTTRNAANDLTGTPWDLGAAEFDPLADLFLDGVQWMMHAGQGDLTAVGRNTGLQNEWHNQNSSVVGFINGLLNTAGPGELTRRIELIAMRDRLQVNGEIVGNKAFWDLGLQVQARSDYYASVKIGSERTTGPESGVGNGLLNFHMNDGVTQIMQHGNEYNNAKVAWNWRALPGITAEQRTDALPLVNWGGNGQRGDNVFGGSVSNGLNGLSAFYFNKENTYATVNANKGYYFFDKEFVALGSGVQRESSGQGKEIWTTLNQAERFSNVTYNVGSGDQTIGLGTNLQQDFSNLTSPVWFHQDGVGYVIVPKSGSQVNVKLWAENRTGNWSDIGIQTGTTTVNMFQLAINHGTNPNNNNTNNYQYVVVPNITAAAMGNYVSNLMPTILSNTTSLQAVQHATLGLTEITFYQAGSFQVPGGPMVSVDQPALVMLQATAGGGYEVSVSDPNHSTSLSQINVTMGGNWSGTGAVYNSGTNKTTTAFAVSTVNVLAGKSVVTQLQNADRLSVASVTIGDDSTARSMVKTAVVEFDDVVTFDPGAFMVTLRGTTTTVGVTAMPSINPLTGKSVVTLTFSGIQTSNGSLKDGNYTLTINESMVRSTTTGGYLDADGNASSSEQYKFGDNNTDKFYRLFGDINGDRIVNAFDLLRFRQAYQKVAGDPLFSSQFDSNGDGVISALDLLPFRLNYGKSLPF